MNKYTHISLVVIGAIIVTSLTIRASDQITFTDGQLALLTSSTGSMCDDGAILVTLRSGSLCVDKFEATPTPSCPVVIPQSEVDTRNNIAVTSCKPGSVAGEQPWRFVSQTEAQQLCARAGKRLPSAAEWYSLALTLTDDSGCITSSAGPQPTGVAVCTTDTGVFDLVGNVWEWVYGDVTSGTYANRPVPSPGYVAEVDSDGIVTVTAGTAQAAYGNDYAETNQTGTYGIIRGGFYGSGSDAGLYAQNLAVPFSLQTAGIGFRCVRDVIVHN